jgi:hypothetical protein
MGSAASRKLKLCLLTAALLLGGISARGQIAETAGASSGAIHLSFPDQDKWLGADDAYSIPLGNGRSLWLFGDTFIGEKADSVRTAKSGFIRNSIGITTCMEQKCSVEYFWAQMKGTKPDSFFSAPGTDWYWPMDGFIHNGTLYVALMQMHAEGAGAMGFAFSGTQMAVIPNYTRPPEQWKIEYESLNTGPNAVPGVSIVVKRGPNGNPNPADPKGANYAYFFTLVQGATPTAQHLGLLRIALDKLGDAARPAGSGWEYMKGDQSWAAWPKNDTVLPADHAAVLTPGATEMSVRYHEATKQWIAVYPEGGLVFKKANYALSDAMTHGWQASKTLFTYPEMAPTHPNYTTNVFCYAAKEHVELEREGQLFFTYACNSFKEDELFEKTKLYRPMPVTVPLPKN